MKIYQLSIGTPVYDPGQHQYRKVINITQETKHQWLIALEDNRYFAGHDNLELMVACPICLKPSAYVSELDRFVHKDGTDNRRCWIELMNRP